MHRYSIVICYLLFVQLCNVNSQYSQSFYKRGYIVHNNGDTTRGYIYTQINAINAFRCDFRIHENESPTKYSPNDIKAYCINDYKYYVSKKILIDSVETDVFLEFLVDGIVDLYFLKFGTERKYYIEKEGKMYELSNEERTVKYEPNSFSESLRYGNSQVYTKHSNQYIGMLCIIFQDCPEIVKEARNTKFEYKNLIKITKDYHYKVCANEECIVYSK